MGYRLLTFLTGLLIAATLPVHAAPARIIHVPTAATIEYGTWRFDMENQNTLMVAGASGGRNLINYGLSAGLIPYTVSKSFGIEVGLDYRDSNGSAPAAADSPLFLNMKLGFKEGALFTDSFPAIAVGLWDFGGKGGVTAANIMYLAVSKEIATGWQVNGGFYSGNGSVLTDSSGNASGSGPMLSVDWRASKEWWFAGEFIGGANYYSGVSAGAGYYLLPAFRIGGAYNMYTNSSLKPTISFQIVSEF